MKKLSTLFVILALCTVNVFAADNDKDDKKVPPGLQKKGGVPPGQAKKKGQAEETTPTPAATPAPAAAPAVATPAAPAPSATPTATPVVAKPAAAAKPALADQKAALEKNARAINQPTKANPALHKAALQHIAKQTGVSLEHLKEQDQKFPNASDAALLLGNVIAKKANVKFADVLQARQAGKNWDEIAKKHNVGLDVLVQESAELAAALRSAGAR